MLSISKPHVRTQQQNIYTAEGQVKFSLFWNRYSDRVATFSSIENPYLWENGFCTYLGFPTKAVAIAWQQHLLRIGVATSAEYRKVNRLAVGKPKNCAIRWELKVRGLSYRQLLHLLTFDLTATPPQPEQRATAHDFEISTSAQINGEPTTPLTRSVPEDIPIWVRRLFQPSSLCDRVKVINTFAGAEDSRIGSLGTIESRDVRTNTIEVRVDGQKFGTLLLKPEWAVKVDAVEFPNCCELPEPIDKSEPQLEQSEAVEVEPVDVPREVAVSHRDRDVEECLATELKLELAAQPEPQAFQVGDRVEITSDRHGNELVEVIGIVSAASKVGCAVNVKGQLRWFCNDELMLVEKSAQPREALDDLFPPVDQEHITPQLLNYNATPYGRRGAVANWNARQASGRGVRNSGTGLKTMDEWRRMEQQQKLAVALAALPDDDDELPF